MKHKILLYGFLAVMITGCSTAYKASQTPDDVYYSPASVQKESNRNETQEDYSSTDEDRYLRMKTRDHQRWSTLDDYAYWNDSRYVPSLSYDYYRDNWNNTYAWNNWNSSYYYPMYAGNYNYYGSYYHPYGYNSYGYNTYNTVYISKYPTRPTSNVNRPNLNGYLNNSYGNSNTYNRQGLGSTIKRVFTPSTNTDYSNRNATNNNTNNTNTTPSRSYSPSSSGGSSSSSSGSSSGHVSRPH